MPEIRKLAAILAADIAGYSKLAGADEEQTLARLRAPFASAPRSASLFHRRSRRVRLPPASRPPLLHNALGRRDDSVAA
jgi:class 3 adenylate cyclase